MKRHIGMGFILVVLFGGGTMQARTLLAGPTDFRDSLSVLVPGDTLFLIPGNYTLSLRLTDLSGTNSAPIMISGQPGQTKPTFLGNACCNTISLTRCSYLHLKDLVCQGQNIAGIDALKAMGGTGNWAHHIEVEGLEAYGYGASQQNVGISTKCPSWSWHIHHNIIDGAGTGFYLGDSNGEEPFADGIVEYNLIKNTVGYNGQIKHQNVNTRDLSLGMPANGKTIIRYNVFSKAQGASSGTSSRPNLLVGNFPASGNGSQDYYEIYGNFIFQNPTEGLFQGTGNVSFYDNVLYNDLGGWGIAIQTHNGFQPREIDVFHNTVLVNTGTGLSFSGLNMGFTQRAWANVILAPTQISGSPNLDGNVSAVFTQSTAYVKDPSMPLATMDLTSLNTALQITGINLSTFQIYTDHDRDFEGKLRDGSYAGAYFGENLPSWPLALDIRTNISTDVISSAKFDLGATSIELYPCPATDEVLIDGLLGAYDIYVLDANGMVHQNLSTSASSLTLDITALPAGVFFISVRNKTNGLLHVEKLIKS